jgi:hypothetical protein
MEGGKDQTKKAKFGFLEARRVNEISNANYIEHHER